MQTITIELRLDVAKALSEELSDWSSWQAVVKFSLKESQGWEAFFIPDIMQIRQMNARIKQEISLIDVYKQEK